MEIYYITIAIMFLYWTFVEIVYRNKKKKNMLLCGVFFILIFLILALRHPSMGIDLGYGTSYGYLSSFSYLSRLPIKELIMLNGYLNYEMGYILLNRLIGVVSNDQQFFLACCAFISLLPVSYVIWKKSDNICLSYFIYLGLPVFLLLFSGIRQSIAIGLCFYSIIYIQEKKLFKFVAIIIIATLFHSSAIIFLISYPLYYLKVSLKKRLVSIIVIPIVYVFRTPIFMFLGSFLKDNIQIDNNGSIKLLFLLIIIYLFCTIFTRWSEEKNGYLNLFYCACLCQVFANVYSISLRIGYYFIIFLSLKAFVLKKNVYGISN